MELRDPVMNCSVGFLTCGSHSFKGSWRFGIYRNKRRVCFREYLCIVHCKYIVGVNKYSHDASVCLVDSDTGDIVVNCAKERISRRKHDGNDVGQLVERIFSKLGIDLEDIDLVVQNNHHYRVRTFEEKLPWTTQLNYYPREYLSPYNLLPQLPKIEISHHLAHVWSVYPQLAKAFSSNKDSLILVMDGMGESSRELAEHSNNNNIASNMYIHDMMSITSKETEEWKAKWSDKCYPKEIKTFENFREAESCYRCSNDGVELLWKRWTRERSPPELYNHSFEDMESVGAVYSRIASHIFGDWNSCGKVMGLAAYHTPRVAHTSSRFKEWMERLDCENILSGHLPERLDIHWDLLEQLPCPNQWNECDKDLFQFYAALAYRIQKDTETVVMSLVERLAEQHKVPILGLCGGVFLNSSLNGKILNDSRFRHVWIPPYPGDEGVAIGCALYGYQHYTNKKNKESLHGNVSRASPTSFSPFLGLCYTSNEVEEAVQEYLPWVEEVQASKFIKHHSNPLIAFVAEQLYRNNVVAVCRGRSESGPRALGNRSILANPSDPNMKYKLNQKVKFRESFRPFAPTVLEEHFADMLHFNKPVMDISESCRYMSFTLPVKEEMVSKIFAAVHVDNTARVQVLRRNENSWFYEVIREFCRLSKIPAVLNTSFNIRGEPIVESPFDAFESFLDPGTAIDWLIVEDRIFRKKSFPRRCLSMTISITNPIQIHSVENPLADEIDFKVVDMNGKVHPITSYVDASILQLAATKKYTCDDIIRELMEESEYSLEDKHIVERIQRLWEYRLISLVEI